MPNPFGPAFGDEWFIDEAANVVVTEDGVFPLKPVTVGLNELVGAIEAAAELVSTATQTHKPTTTVEAAAEVVGVLTVVDIVLIGSVEAVVEVDGSTLTVSAVFVGWGIPVGVS